MILADAGKLAQPGHDIITMPVLCGGHSPFRPHASRHAFRPIL